MLWFYLLLSALLVALNAFFVQMEYAMVATRPERLLSVGRGHPALEQARKWVEDDQERTRFIAAVQIAITFIGLALGAVSERAASLVVEQYLPPVPQGSWLAPVLHSLPLAVALIVVTGVQVTLGEQVPKVAVLRNPERVLLRGARPMQAFIIAFRWLIWSLNSLTLLTLRLLNLPIQRDQSLTLEELRLVLHKAQEEGVLPSEEGEMLDAVLDLPEMLVRHIMVPRTEIVAVEAEAPLGHILALAAKHDLTKFPVYRNNLDNVLGMVHVNQVLKLLHTPEFERLRAKDLATKVLFVPESLPVRELLHRFRETRQHMALVLDEYGGIAGLVTLHDVVEEIVGQFEDMFGPKERPDVQFLPDGSVRLDGMALLSDVSETLGVPLHSEYYDTVAGFILERLGRIPKPGESVDVPELGIRLIVESMDGLRIDQVRMVPLRKGERLPRPTPEPTNDRPSTTDERR